MEDGLVSTADRGFIENKPLREVSNDFTSQCFWELISKKYLKNISLTPFSYIFINEKKPNFKVEVPITPQEKRQIKNAKIHNKSERE